jgi:hypothetical protein
MNERTFFEALEERILLSGTEASGFHDLSSNGDQLVANVLVRAAAPPVATGFGAVSGGVDLLDTATYPEPYAF